MGRPFHDRIALILFLVSFQLFGQVGPEERVTVLPASNCWVGERDVSLFSSSNLYRLFVCDGQARTGRFQLEVFDVMTAHRVFQTTLRPPGPENERVSLENAVLVGDLLWVFFTTIGREQDIEGFVLNAWPVDPSTGETVGGRERVGFVPFGVHRSRFPHRIGTVIGSSANGEYVAIMYDRLLDFSVNNLLFLWLLGPDMKEVRSTLYKVQYDWSHRSSPELVEAIVTNDGTVYAVSNASFMGTAPAEQQVPRTQMLRLDANGYVPVLGSFIDQAQAQCGYAIANSGQVFAATVGVIDGTGWPGDEQLVGLCIDRLGSDLKRGISSGWIAFPEPLAGFFADMVVHLRADGGGYVVVSTQGYLGADACGIMVASFDPALKLEWLQQFPREHNGKGTVYSGITENGLDLVVPELGCNVEAWKTGKKLKDGGSGPLPMVTIRFERDGSYTIRVDEQHLLMSCRDLRSPKAPVQLCEGSKKEGKRQVRSHYILRFH